MSWPLPPRHMPKAGEPDFFERMAKYQNDLNRWYITWVVIIVSLWLLVWVLVMVATALNWQGA